jgi:hypothetical protein
MDQMNPICVLHDRRLTTMMDSVNALAAGQAKISAELEGMRREMEIGFKGAHKRHDDTNERVTALEPKVQRLEVSMAAQDVFTPGLSRDIMQFEQAVQAKVDHLWKAVHTLEERERDLHSTQQKAKGVVEGAAGAGKLTWALGSLVAAFVAWVINLWVTYLQAHPKPGP